MKYFSKLVGVNNDNPKVQIIFWLNLIHLLNYFEIWIIDDLKVDFQAEEDNIVGILELIFSIFKKFGILYATFPDFRVSVNQLEVLESLKRMESQNNLLKNGGIFFTMLNCLMNLLSKVKNPANENKILKMLSIILNLKPSDKLKEKFEDKIWQNTDLIQKIEASNTKLSAELDVSSFMSYFGPIPSKPLPSKPIVLSIFDYLF